MAAEDEFVPCRPTCQTCRPGDYPGGGAMRWTPDMPAFQPGPSVEPYSGPVRGLRLHGAWVDEAFPPPVLDLEAPTPPVTPFVAMSRPVPRRPIAGLDRRLLP